MSTIATLEAKLRLDAQGFHQETRNVESSVSRMAGFIRNTLSTAGGFALGNAGVSLISRAFDAAKDAVIGFNAKLEQSEMAWSVFLGGGENAKLMMFELQQFAAKTPFEFEGVEQGARMLMGFGFAAKDVIPILTDIGDAAAALGLGSEGITRMIYQLGQMQAKGKVTAEDTMVLAEAGVNLGKVYETMAAQTGKAVGELQNLQDKGQLSADTFMAAFRTFVQQNYGGMMANQAKTFSGAMSTIWDSLKIGVSTAFQPFFAALSELAQAIAAFVSSDQFMQWAAKVAAVSSLAVDGIRMVASAFMTYLPIVLSIVTTIGGMIYEALSYLNPFATHSPSLVESVDWGVDRIVAKYGQMELVTGPLMTTSNAMRMFADTVRMGLAAVDASTMATQMKALTVFGVDVPAAFQAATEAVQGLEAELLNLSDAIDAQQAVVDGIRGEMENLNDQMDELRDQEEDASSASSGFASSALDTSRMLKPFEDAVERAQAQVSDLQNALTEAQNSLQRFAQTPIQGTKAFSDRAFELNQQIAGVQRRLNDLKRAHAPAAAMKELEDRLEDLQLQAQNVQLDEQLQLGPLRRQVEQLANPMEELPFDQIVAGVKAAQAQIASLQPQLTGAESALTIAQETLKAQRAALDEMSAGFHGAAKSASAYSAAMKELQTKYQALQKQFKDEQKRLGDLQGAYNDVKGKLGDWGSALDQIASKAEQLQKTNEAAAKNAATGWGESGNQLADLDEQLAETKRKYEDWKTSMDSFKASLEERIKPFFEDLQTALENFKSQLEGADKVVKSLRTNLGLDEGAGTEKKGWLRDFQETGIGNLAALTQAMNDFGDAIGRVNGGGGGAGGGLAFLIQLLTWVTGLAQTLTFAIPITTLQSFSEALTWVEGPMRSLQQAVDDLGKAWDDLRNNGSMLAYGELMLRMLNVIWSAFVTVMAWIVGLVWGAVKAIGDLFVRLWNALVGHSIIPDLVNGILGWFNVLLQGATEIFNKLGETVVGIMNTVIRAVNSLIEAWNRTVGSLPGGQKFGTIAELRWTNLPSPQLGPWEGPAVPELPEFNPPIPAVGGNGLVWNGNVNVEGSVRSDRDLVQMIRDALEDIGRQNVGISRNTQWGAAY